MAQAGIETLIQKLRSADDWTTRRQAALALGRQGGRDGFDALAAALGDRDADVRQAAVLSLARLRDPRAIELLCRPMLLEDPTPEIRWATVTALGQLGSLRNANEVSRALDDPDWVVRNQALLAISDFIRRVPDSVDGEQIKALIRLLAIPDDEVHGLVVEALARRSTLGLDEMVDALKLKSAVVRAGVAEALGQSQDPRAVEPLVDATRDSVAAVRRRAAEGLGRLGDVAAVEALVVLLGDSDAATGQAAVRALIRIGEPAVSALCTALEHPLAKHHRRAVILTLGGIRDRRAVIPLLNSLSSTYYVVRRAAQAALSAYGDSIVDDLIAMVENSEVPIESLLRELHEQQNKRLRLRAVRALGEIKNAAAIKPLRKLMQERDREVIGATQEALSKIGLAAWGRYGAVIVLGATGSRRAVPALIEALGDHSEYVRTEAARALGKLGDAGAVDGLLRALESDEDARVRHEAAVALRAPWARGPRATAAFQQALSDASWEVRAEAARALGRIDDESSVEPLLGALEDASYTVMTSAENALANLGRLALPRLVETAAEEETLRLLPALRALAELFGEPLTKWPEALAALPAAERRAELQRLAAKAQQEPAS